MSPARSSKRIPPRSIFISYNRKVSGNIAGRIYDRLNNHFSPGAVFKDNEDPELGVDFMDSFKRALEACQIVLVIIDPDWYVRRNTVPPKGDGIPPDWVKMEVELALSREGVRVIPVLVDGADTPDNQVLPDSLAGLRRRYFARIHGDEFGTSMDALIVAIEKAMAAQKKGAKLAGETKKAFPWIWFAVAALVIAGGLGLATFKGGVLPKASGANVPAPSGPVKPVRLKSQVLTGWLDNGKITYKGASGPIRELTHYVIVEFTLENPNSEAIQGPLQVDYYLKDLTVVQLDPEAVVPLAPVSDSSWKAKGFTRSSSWPILSEPGDVIDPNSGSRTLRRGILVGPKGKLAFGEHDLGLVITDANKNVCYQGEVKLDVKWETDPSTAKLDLKVLPGGDAAAATRVKTFTLVDQAQNKTEIDTDLLYQFQLTNKLDSPLGELTYSVYFPVRKPFDPPSAELSIVGTLGGLFAPASNFPPQQTGSTSFHNWKFGSLVLNPNESTEVLDSYLTVGRGGYIPPGSHPCAIEVFSGSESVYRGLFTVQAPEGPARPGLELVDQAGKVLVPGSVINAEVNQKLKDEDLTVTKQPYRREVTVSFNLSYEAYGITSSEQHPDRPQFSDISWVLLAPESLHLYNSAVPIKNFQNGTSVVTGLAFLQGAYFGTLEPGDPAPVQNFEQFFALDPAALSSREGKPGLWFSEGDYPVRIMALLRRTEGLWATQLNDNQLPDRKHVLFERDFILRVTQPNPVVLDSQ